MVHHEVHQNPSISPCLSTAVDSQPRLVAVVQAAGNLGSELCGGGGGSNRAQGPVDCWSLLVCDCICWLSTLLGTSHSLDVLEDAML